MLTESKFRLSLRAVFEDVFRGLLEQHGVRVVATITSIEAHAMFTRVTAYWQHPQTRQVYPCHSWMLFNQLSLQPGRQVQVLVDPTNYHHYCMKVAR